MKKIYKDVSAKKLAGYSAMAATLVATQADAQTIVYVDIDDITVEIGDIVQIDVDGDGTDDFLFQAASSGTNWTFGRVFGNVTSYAVGASSNKVAGYNGYFLPYGSALDAGQEVGPTLDFIGSSSTNPGNVAFLNSIYSSATYGQFSGVEDKYLGFQFEVGGNLHYGWMRLDGTVGPVTLTIKDMAFNSDVEGPIEAGDTGEPVVGISEVIDPSQLNVYSFGNTVNVMVYGLEANTAQIQIVNMLGETVYNNGLDMSGMTISLATAAEGIYTVNIVADGKVYNKQVYINNQ